MKDNKRSSKSFKAHARGSGAGRGLAKAKFSTRNKIQSERQLRVSQLINNAVLKYFREGSLVDIRLINCPLTITKVTVSADLKIANCFVLPFNTELPAEEILEALEESAFEIRKFVTKEINLKYSSELRFFYDNCFETVNIIEAQMMLC